VQKRFRHFLAPVDTKRFLPVGVVHSECGFQPWRVVLIDAGSLSVCGTVAVGMLFESNVRSQSIVWLFHALSYFTAGYLSGGKPSRSLR
jgi:hypothetical protein